MPLSLQTCLKIGKESSFQPFVIQTVTTRYCPIRSKDHVRTAQVSIMLFTVSSSKVLKRMRTINPTSENCLNQEFDITFPDEFLYSLT